MRRLLVGSGIALLAACAAGCGDAGTAQAEPAAARVQAYSFTVEVVAEGAAYPFKSCSGLGVETDVVEVREGGANGIIRKVPGVTRWPNLVLKRAFAGEAANDPIQNWVRSVNSGQVVRKDITIVIRRHDQAEVARYTFYRCFPVKWSLPLLDLDANERPDEEITLAVEQGDPP